MTTRDFSSTVAAARRLSCGSALAMLCSAPALAGVGVDTSELNEAVTLEGVKSHLEVFQQIADDNDGNREASSSGYFDSVSYVGQAMALAGYRVNVQLFPYLVFENNSPAEFAQVSPVPTSYVLDEEEGFAEATYSGSGDVTATVEAVDLVVPAAPDADTSNSGCEAEDFADFTPGNIALLQRGSCSFFLKAANAEDAGASAVIIFNEGQPGRTAALSATLGGPGVSIPVVGTSYVIGTDLAAAESTARVSVDALTEERVSANVLADTPIGNPDETVVVGAHLDSVDDGAGINDNGSGSAVLLEVALQMSALGYLDDEETGVRNRVRFAWWGAEEAGLLGSEYYVNTVSDAEFAQIVANLNFDMVGSPNYVRFVYDGDGSAGGGAGPEGSAFIEWLFNDYFMEQGLATAPTAFDGRSDYGPFIQYGIPAGGLFTGAEGVKTEEEAGIFGGVAGEAYDACYHAACDTIENISDQGLDEMADATAYAINVLAVNDLPIPSAKESARKRIAGQSGMDMNYRGNRLQK